VRVPPLVQHFIRYSFSSLNRIETHGHVARKLDVITPCSSLPSFLPIIMCICACVGLQLYGSDWKSALETFETLGQQQSEGDETAGKKVYHIHTYLPS
jgi:hypothetical protein